MADGEANGCLATESDENNVLQLKQKGLNQESLVQGYCSSCSNTSAGGDGFDQTPKASQENRPSKRKETHNFLVPVESESAHHNVKQQVVVLEWPILEKVLRFYADDMDSRRMFVFVAPGSGSVKDGDCVLYLWVGKAFRHDNRSLLETNKRRAELPDFAMKEIINKVLSEMGLSKDTRVKIVKQDEEPSEFVALLSSL